MPYGVWSAIWGDSSDRTRFHPAPPNLHTLLLNLPTAQRFPARPHQVCPQLQIGEMHFVGQKQVETHPTCQSIQEPLENGPMARQARPRSSSERTLIPARKPPKRRITSRWTKCDCNRLERSHCQNTESLGFIFPQIPVISLFFFSQHPGEPADDPKGPEAATSECSAAGAVSRRSGIVAPRTATISFPTTRSASSGSGWPQFKTVEPTQPDSGACSRIRFPPTNPRIAKLAIQGLTLGSRHKLWKRHETGMDIVI